jgi:hypothetical protein
MSPRRNVLTLLPLLAAATWRCNSGDIRTGVETGNPDAVLDRDIDRVLAAALAARIKGADAITANT